MKFYWVIEEEGGSLQMVDFERQYRPAIQRKPDREARPPAARPKDRPADAEARRQ